MTVATRRRRTPRDASPPAATPTGLDNHQIRALRRPERIALAAWHETRAGNDNGRPWLPHAIRRLKLEQRLALAGDEDLDAAWVERERRRCQTSVEYFVDGYGHLQDDEGAGPIPFLMWPEQREILARMVDELLLAVAKARQLGLTWLALHRAHHLLALDPATPGATVLALSQDGGYAKRLLERARRINDLTPPYLRLPEDRETRDSKTEFKLAGRGRMISLAGTPDAPRSYQAALAICDEWAFVRNGQAGPTMTALRPAARQIVAISSGNGGPDEPGTGQHFARLVTRALAGQSEWRAAFLPASTHPDRTAAWRAAEVENYDTEEEFLAEHPETIDDALIGAGKDRYFKLAHVNAAILLGAELDALLGTEEMPDPVGDAIRTCADYGDVMTQGYVIWPLEGGGFYVPPSEVALAQSEPEEISVKVHHAAAELQDVDPRTGRLWPPISDHRFDNAGKQTNRAYMTIARSRFAHQHEHQTPRSTGVRFRESKRETAGYLRRLFKRAGEGRRTGVAAVSPANAELVRQLRGLQSAPDGLWKKEDDHGPDAIVAGVADLARRHRELRGD